MTSANAPTGGQVPVGGQSQGQVPTTSPVTPDATGQVPAPGTNGDDHLTAEQLRDTVRKLRDDAAKERLDRKRLAELEKAEQDRQTANLSDQQKAAQRAEAAEASLTAVRSRIGASELKVAALSAGIIDPDLAPALLGTKVEYDGEGEPKNIADLVKALKSDKPHLFAAANGQPQSPPARPASSGGATNPGAGGVQPGAAGGSGATITAASFRAMSQQERVLRMKDVETALVKYGGRLPA